MDLKKISNVVKSKNIQYDLLGNAISVGDIIAIAYHNRMHYGLVYEVTDRFIRAYDKQQMDDGKNIQIGRGIVGEQCLVIQKLMNKDIVDNIIEIGEQNKEKAKQEKKFTPKKIMLKWKDISNNTVGFLIWPSISSKSGYVEAIAKAKEKYPNYEFQVLNKNKEWQSTDTILMSELKFVGLYNTFYGTDNPNDWSGFTLFELPVEVRKNYNKLEFWTIPTFTEKNYNILNYRSKVFTRYKELSYPIKCIADLQLDMEYIRDYNSFITFENLKSLF